MLDEYFLFLAQTLTVVFAVLFIVAAVAQQRRQGGAPGWLQVRTLNDAYRQRQRALQRAGGRIPLAQRLREVLANREKEETLPDRRLFVLDFHGDPRARAVEALREEVTAVLAAARPGEDEVVLRLESPGGTVPAYGLAASQLVRLREQGIGLTVCVDRVAASGGYLMAAVGDRIVAAPFALVGSIGVVGALPNFHRWLKNRDIDFEQHTAGDYKRTLTLFGENTDADRAKFQEDLESIHEQFKGFIGRYRPGLDVDRVATGEFWLAEQASSLGLVDELKTSDDFLMARREEARLVEVRYRRREGMAQRMAPVAERLFSRRDPVDTPLPRQWQ